MYNSFSIFLQRLIYTPVTFFIQLPKPSGVTPDPDLDASVANESVYLAEELSGLPDCVQTDAGPVLTDVGRQQVGDRGSQTTPERGLFRQPDPDTPY